MNRLEYKSDLTHAEARLIEQGQDINFGRIESLTVRRGQPVMDPPPRVVRKLRIGGENGSRPEAGLRDFVLKREMVELIEVIREMGDGVVRSIEIRHGLPVSIEVESLVAVRG